MSTFTVGDEVMDMHDDCDPDEERFRGIVVQIGSGKGVVTVVWDAGEGRYGFSAYGKDAAAIALTRTGRTVTAAEALAMHNNYRRSRGLPERME